MQVMLDALFGSLPAMTKMRMVAAGRYPVDANTDGLNFEYGALRFRAGTWGELRRVLLFAR